MMSDPPPAGTPAFARQSSVDVMVDGLGLKGLRENELAAVKLALSSLGFATTDCFKDRDALAELTTSNLKRALAAAGVSASRSGGVAIQLRTALSKNKAVAAPTFSYTRTASFVAIFVAGWAMVVSSSAASSKRKGKVGDLAVLLFGWAIMVASCIHYRDVAWRVVRWVCSHAWWAAKWCAYLYWRVVTSPFFYGWKAIVYFGREAQKWDVTRTRSPDGRGVVVTWTNRETGQVIVSSELDTPAAAPAVPVPSAGRGQGTRTIATWLHCSIGRTEPHRVREFRSRMRVDGREHRLVAHIDTGNAAHTVFSAHMFDALFPLRPGSATDRPGLQYLGSRQIRGVTGGVQVLQLYRGVRVKFEGLRSARNKELVFTMDVLRQHENSAATADVPGARAGGCPYHDLLVSSHDMKRLLDAHGHTIKVVSYRDFVAMRRRRQQ